ncbi:hypothetical protein G3576_27895 [Roseomonas stagni]|uniref:Uncharacterized protein n=1 Tax=Falsiroseomonas algicola TaxID=2716930 RepID=A0A6M1LTT2_9PROT|nr:hypothetical protein [Falsiroseomonas algicola]NGM23860.1 hypothetical protein [Falsiroseomonas algicola]
MIDPALEQVVADDLDYLSAMISNSTIRNANIRHSSTILRNLICYDHLQKVADARGSVIQISIPEARALLRHIEDDPLTVFFQLAGYYIFGVQLMAAFSERRQHPADRPFDPNVRFDAPLKTFKNQPVFFFRSFADFKQDPACAMPRVVKVSREAVIRYITNKTGGAHYDTDRRTPEEQVLEIVQRSISFYMRDGNPAYDMHLEALENFEIRSRKPLPGVGPNGRDRLDAVSLELLGAAQMLISSPSVIRLRTQLCT